MLNDLSTVKIFLQVADDGSFSATARRHNMSVSSIARQVSGIEDQLGVRLLNRTTRHQKLTDVGKFYYQKMRGLIAEFEAIDGMARSYNGLIQGTLRVHLRTSIARLIIPKLALFLAEYPDVTIDITLTEERIDLVSGGVDVAVWLGSLEDSNYIARRLSFTERVLVASRAYLDAAPPLEKPEDLTNHQCIIFTRAQYSKDSWRLLRGGEAFDVPVSGRVSTQSGWALYDFVRADLGVAMVQKWMVLSNLQDGSMLRILPNYDCNPVEFDVPLYVVYPHSRGLPIKTRVFVDFLVNVFHEHVRINGSDDIAKLLSNAIEPEGESIN